MKKILILGASGFIGRNLTEYLKNKYELHTPARSELNILDSETVERYIKSDNFDVVLNALDRRMDISTPQAAATYVLERLRMFENLSRLNGYYGKMLYFGTGAEYARTLPIESITEDQFDRAIPEDPYGFLMYTMQMLALRYDNITNFRLFGIFGPYEVYSQRFISNAICKALCGYPITIRQNAVFDYLYTDDLCKMVEYYIENPMRHRMYNAASGKRYELVSLAQSVKKQVGIDVPTYIAKPGYNKEYTASNAQILKELNEFKIGLIENHIEKLVNYYKSRINKIDKEALLYNKIENEILL